MDSRHRFLAEWAGFITNAAKAGAVTGKPVTIQRVEGVCGPRAGALELLLAELDAGRLKRAFSKDDAATCRQLIPWAFPGAPQVFMAGRFLRLECPWPDHLSEKMIRLGDLGSRPKTDGRFVVGKSEMGSTVIAGLNDRTSHFLVAGATGSGKTIALRSACVQLSKDTSNQLILIDGKAGESLACVSHLRGVVGPTATEPSQMRAALGWVAEAMRERYTRRNGHGRIIVVFDEFQEAADDQVIVDLLRKIAGQGRAARVHLLAATQHPNLESFGGPATRRNLVGRLVLRVSDGDASRVACGASLPKAQNLLGAGDTYALSPGVCVRVQGAYVDELEIDQAETGAWEFDEWPTYQAEAVGQNLPQKRRGWSYRGAELAVSIVSASEAEGRPAMVKRLNAAGLGRPGAERAIRLLDLGRDAHEWLNENDFYISQFVD